MLAKQKGKKKEEESSSGEQIEKMKKLDSRDGCIWVKPARKGFNL